MLLGSGLLLVRFMVPKAKDGSCNIISAFLGRCVEHDMSMINMCVLFLHRPIGWFVWVIRCLGGPPFDGVRRPAGGEPPWVLWRQ